MDYRAPQHRFLGWPPRADKSHVFTEYPKIVTDLLGRRITVRDAEHEAQVMGIPQEVKKAPAPRSDEPSADATREQLIEYCVATQTPIDKRWGIDKLRQAIISRRGPA